jgi:hypothetical protein
MIMARYMLKVTEMLDDDRPDQRQTLHTHQTHLSCPQGSHPHISDYNPRHIVILFPIPIASLSLWPPSFHQHRRAAHRFGPLVTHAP